MITLLLTNSIFSTGSVEERLQQAANRIIETGGLYQLGDEPGKPFTPAYVSKLIHLIDQK